MFDGDFSRGVPDGSAMDADGFLWNARWGGSCIVRFSPEGAVDRVIDIPATNVTSCAFGGPDGRTLFATTARSGLSAQLVKNNPLEGAVFAIRTATPGMDVPLFSD